MAGLRRFIAEPLGFVASTLQHLLLQEFIDGTPLTRFATPAGTADRRSLQAQLEGIVAAAHRSAIYDLDLHPRNILVRLGPDGSPSVVLFDFSKIPYHEFPPNPVARWLVALGLTGPAAEEWRARTTDCWLGVPVA